MNKWKDTPLTVEEALNLMIMTSRTTELEERYRATIELVASRCLFKTRKDILFMEAEDFSVLSEECSKNLTEFIFGKKETS